MKTTLKKNKIFSRFLLNLGANLSWGWLSSLRFYIVMSLTNLIVLKLLKFNINVQCVTKELKGKYAWLFAADAKPSS